MVSLLLHLYQPFFQTENVLAQIVETSYLPLLKTIKQRKNIKVTLNVPLSLLELLQKYNHTRVLDGILELLQHDRIELVGSAAYHPLLTKIPTDAVESQIILNEYALGYFFGRRTGFDGEDSILVKDLRGFFPPELALNGDVLKTVSELGYKWIVADAGLLPDVGAVDLLNKYLVVSDVKTHILVRDAELSNAIAFKRNSDITDIESALVEGGLICLDAETFGHHNPDGILLFLNIVDFLQERNLPLCSVSEYHDYCSSYPINAVSESSWGMASHGRDIYPLWKTEHPVNVAFNELYEFLSKITIDVPDDRNMLNAPLWDSAENPQITMYILLSKLMCSDQLWWSSNAIIFENMQLYSPKILDTILKYYDVFAISLKDESLREGITTRTSSIRQLLNS